MFYYQKPTSCYSGKSIETTSIYQRQTDTVDFPAQIHTLGDINGDGYGDLAVTGTNQSYNANYIRLLQGSATGLVVAFALQLWATSTAMAFLT